MARRRHPSLFYRKSGVYSVGRPGAQARLGHGGDCHAAQVRVGGQALLDQLAQRLGGQHRDHSRKDDSGQVEKPVAGAHSQDGGHSGQYASDSDVRATEGGKSQLPFAVLQASKGLLGRILDHGRGQVPVKVEPSRGGAARDPRMDPTPLEENGNCSVLQGVVLAGGQDGVRRLFVQHSSMLVGLGQVG